MHPETGSRLHLVLFGGLKSRDKLRDVPVSYTYLGTVRQTADLSRLYGAADVLVSASYYETFGQTLIEAQACGCVPVAFGGSGQQDIISHKANGYLADYLSTRSLAEGIYWAMTEGAHLSRQALRQTVVSRYATPRGGPKATGNSTAACCTGRRRTKKTRNPASYNPQKPLTIDLKHV